jgi:predicted O-methyltransferase YrrM
MRIMPNRLDALALKHGTDKSSRYHRYTDAYHQLFLPLRRKPLRIVEIGVATGASVRLWRDFFPNAQVYGIDRNPAARSHQGPRIKVFVGDQSDRVFLQSFKRKVGKIDIIIDDGSHRPEHQLTSLKFLFPLLRVGGVYVIEDLCCSYLEGYGPSAGLHNPRNAVEYLKQALDVIHSEAQHGGLVGDEVTENINAIFCFPRIAFLFKGPALKALPAYHGPDRRTRTRRSAKIRRGRTNSRRVTDL